MSIATEISRLQSAKADIKTAIEGKGVTVPSSTKLDGYATLIDSIETGGGSEGISFDEIATGNFGDGEDVVLDATFIRQYAFSTSKIKSIVANNSSTPNHGAFQSCTKLESVSFPNATDFWNHNNVFQGCTSLINVDMPRAGRMGTQEFYNCTSLEKLYLPNCYQLHSNCMQYCSALTHFETNNSINFSSSGAFSSCSKLMTIIMRGTTVRALNSTNNFNGTTFATGGTHLGHIYVPQSTIASYQSATNWSTLYNAYNDIFLPIEGSEWETVHIDGTPVE